jgi:hypothetical protein
MVVWKVARWTIQRQIGVAFSDGDICIFRYNINVVNLHPPFRFVYFCFERKLKVL